MSVQRIQPTQTVYIRNLNDKIRKSALKTQKMRGQAFVVYQEVSEAAAAIRALQGFKLHDKPMKLEYSKTKSYKAKMLDGESLFDLPPRALLKQQQQQQQQSANKRSIEETEEEPDHEAKRPRQKEAEEEEEDSDMDMSD
ncbi:hypothetical protein MP638_000578 [Amoeboaphelidium occidentale]|nr:hypothetical protein MP638_000578 [Amoeboaphelidium occidentale]